MDIATTLVNLLMMTFRLSIPIALAAIGVTISERSGVINLGIEGIMLLGAFFLLYWVRISQVVLGWA